MMARITSEMVSEIKTTPVPQRGQTVTGYGGRVPTRWMLCIDSRWYRVLMMQYGNSGSAYIVYGGEAMFFETDLEYRIMAV